MGRPRQPTWLSLTEHDLATLPHDRVSVGAVKPRYLVNGSDGVVEAWSTTRLQFEPKGWQREFRAQLRIAIATLASSRQPLAAQYRSPVRDSCDTENILFYNVGTGAFAAASAAGLRFERGFVVPFCHAELDGSPLHYHRYEMGSDPVTYAGAYERTSVKRMPGSEKRSHIEGISASVRASVNSFASVAHRDPRFRRVAIWRKCDMSRPKKSPPKTGAADIQGSLSERRILALSPNGSSLFAGHSGRVAPYRSRSWTRSTIARSSRRVAARAAARSSPRRRRAGRCAGAATSDSSASSPPTSTSSRPAARQRRPVGRS